mgnify:CR=1 FL=1
MILNGSQIFVEVLAEQGVDTIFGLSRRRSSESVRRTI